MLLNGGELDGVRLLTRETVQEMTTNQLPADLVPIHFGPDPWHGMGYGYGLGVVVDPAVLGTPWSKGTYQWLGIGGTAFWADPGEELIVLIMPQALFYFEPLDTLVSLARQAVAE
jgi:CubicO group peptidase (beta-lactamase class C family)